MTFFCNAHSTRRTFLSRLGLLGLASTALPGGFLNGAPAASIPSAFKPAIKNRAPLASNAFYLLPAGSIRPRGWLARQLRIQAAGLTGHLGETWDDVGPNSGWLGGTGESWERGPYYLDGLLPLAYLLDDPTLKAKAQKFIDWTLDHQAADGMLGPSTNDDWWPRFVMLKCLTQYDELTGDGRVIPAMSRYFRHQLSALPSRPLRDWARFRWQDELLSVVWLYNRTGDSYLLDLARILRQQGFDWMAQYRIFKYKQRITSKFIKLEEGKGLEDLALSTHGVNNGQAIKTGPVWSQVSRDPSDRDAILQMIAELDRYHGLPNGMFSCNEHLAGPNPSQGSELCTVVEYMFSLEHALAITGHAALGDRLEKLAFNALPGTLTDDMWAHQYNQEPNQVECSLHHKPWTTDGPESNLYGLEPNFGCCTANFHQGWPKFANSLFMLSGAPDSDSSDGIVAATYAPCEVATVIRGKRVRIIEETDYPFRNTIHFSVSPETAVDFPFALRIPAWATGTTIAVNGRTEKSPKPGSFAQIERKWQPGDRVKVTFPMHPRVIEGFNHSVSIERGPLVFSLGIGESWVKLRERRMTADWQVFPAGDWNYALALNPDEPTKSITTTEAVVGARPFSRKEAAVTLHLKGRRLDAWRAEDGVANDLPESPVESKNPDEPVTLIPYAAAKLRITSFPRAKV